MSDLYKITDYESEYRIGDDSGVERNGLISPGTCPEELILPGTYNGKNVIRIGNNAFDRCGIMETRSIFIPRQIKTIGTHSLGNGEYVNKFEIESGSCLEEIYTNAFESLGLKSKLQLNNLILPPSVKYIGYRAFAWAYGFTAVYYCGTAEISNENAFEGITIGSENFVAYVSQYYKDKYAKFGGMVPQVWSNGECSNTPIFDGIYKYTLNKDGTGLRVGDGTTRSGLNNPNNVPSQIDFSSSVEGFTVLSVSDHAFEGLSSTSAVIQSTVTSIGEMAFSGSKITSVNLGNTKTIGNNAFKSTPITSLTIPQTVSTIQDGAFMNCNLLETVTITEGGGYQNIAQSTFEGCSKLQSFTFPSSIKTIGANAFKDTTGIKTIIIPNTVTSFASSSFQNCGMTSLEITANIAIPTSAFSSCSSLKSAKLSGVTTIGESAFTNAKLTSLEIRVATAISDHAFEGCTALTSVELPSSLQTLSATAFKNSGITSLVIQSGSLAIPAEAFKTCTKLQTVDIKGSKSIGSSAFAQLTSLQTLNTGSTETIDNSAFSGCSNLKTWTFSECLKTIGSNAFNSASIQGGLLLPQSLSLIGTNAFENSKITSLQIFTSSLTISDNAFLNCLSLKTVSISQTSGAIGSSAFSTCRLLETVTLKGVNSIGNSAFRYTEKLKEFIIPQTVTSVPSLMVSNSGVQRIVIEDSTNALNINREAFSNCYDLNEIKFGNRAVTINEQVFSNCPNLKTLSLSGSDTVLHNASLQNSGISRIEAGDGEGILEFSTEALMNNDNIESVVVGKRSLQLEMRCFKSSSVKIVDIKNAKLTSIRSEAFCDCVSLEAIEFPASILTVENSAFRQCTNLQTVEFPANMKRIFAYAFGGTSQLSKISISLDVDGLVIEEKAFEGAGSANGDLTIVLPGGVSEICDSAFENAGISQIVFADGPLEGDPPDGGTSKATEERVEGMVLSIIISSIVADAMQAILSLNQFENSQH